MDTVALKIRVASEIHQTLSELADVKKISLNQLCTNFLIAGIEESNSVSTFIGRRKLNNILFDLSKKYTGYTRSDRFELVKNIKALRDKVFSQKSAAVETVKTFNGKASDASINIFESVFPVFIDEYKGNILGCKLKVPTLKLVIPSAYNISFEQLKSIFSKPFAHDKDYVCSVGRSYELSNEVTPEITEESLNEKEVFIVNDDLFDKLEEIIKNLPVGIKVKLEPTFLLLAIYSTPIGEK